MADTAPRRPPAAGKGRPKGATNKATRAIKDIATGLLSDAKYQDSLKRRLSAGKAPHMETLLHHYAYGKPKDELDLGGSVTITVTRPW